jgi:hypothetical protein
MFDVILARYTRRRCRFTPAASDVSASASIVQTIQFALLQHVHVQRGQCTCSQRVIAQRFHQQ